MKTRILSIGLCVAVVLVATGIVWFTQDRAAIDFMVASSEGTASDAVVGVDSPFEPEMFRFAELATVKWKSAEAMAKTDLDAYAREIGYDLVGVVDANGKVIGSNCKQLIGQAIQGNETLKEFAALYDGKSRYCALPFAESSLLGDGGAQLKLVAMRFPEGGGLVMYGESLRSRMDLHERDYLFEGPMNDWHIGESGSILLVDSKAGVVLSGMEKEYTGMSVEDAGITKLQPYAQGLLQGKVLGVDSLVYLSHLEFVPLDVYIVMPFSEAMRQRDLSALMTALMTSVFLLVGFLVIAKIRRQQKAIDALRVKEDERRQKDMDQAKTIQLSSLETRFPDGVYARIRTAKEVGGDFYDCFMLAPGKLMLVMADVSGKGIPAALFMMRARTEIRAVSKEVHDVAEIMTAVNSRLCNNNSAEMFVTAWLGVLDLSTGTVEWASAGHNPPYLLRADGTVAAISGKRALVLAGMDGIKYRSNSLKLEPGDRIVAYTDGVTEAQSASGDFFGESRLEQVLTKLSGTPKEICDKVFAAVDAFAGSAPQADDITVLTVEFEPQRG